MQEVRKGIIKLGIIFFIIVGIGTIEHTLNLSAIQVVTVSIAFYVITWGAIYLFKK